MNPRAIPVLLLRGHGLVKTVRFRDAQYVGDPINAARLFNDLEVDELIFLDIDATREGREPPFERIREIASECFMPICYGGGITRFEQAQRLFKLGVEKVALTSALAEGPDLIRQIADTFGEQSVVVGIDAKRDWRGRSRAMIRGNTAKTSLDPVQAALHAAALGAGEILIQSVDRDGTYEGYDLELVRAVATAVDVPVIACGGARALPDLRQAIDAGASAAAAGSIFAYKGPHRAVLLNYPQRRHLRDLFEGAAAA